MAKKKKKQWYHVHGVVVGSKYLGRFKASSKEEAEALALVSDAAWVSLCHHCADECEDPEVQDAKAELDDNQTDEPSDEDE